MLILTRRANERILIGEDIAVSVLEIEGRRVKLGIDAPSDVLILREEIIGREEARAANDDEHRVGGRHAA